MSAILISLLVGTGLVITNSSYLRDWYILLTYKPPQVIINLANNDGMTAYAKQLFYVNRPKLDSKVVFETSCPSGTHQSYVIGCYHGGDNGIYLLNVVDPRLNGIVAVTAAYEMLHAGYARLNSNQRYIIDKQMWSFYQANVKNTEIKQQMSVYAATEPGEQYDELYSVLATEVASLPPSIENLYKPYFTNRSKIVALYNGYQSVFYARIQTINNDKTTLSKLKAEISSLNKHLSVTRQQLNTLKVQINNYQATGNIAAANSLIASYNYDVNSYNVLVINARNFISKYNATVVDINSNVLEEQQLVQAINAQAQVVLSKK